ncbi:MAG: limonene,2-epoxide hydrolase [Solirubrobacterales bacterium]|nr:limonene,2-epoxide hydrolase [Solirubrobacterales bacterium]
MGARQEAVVTEMLQAWTQPDAPDRVVAAFAPEGSWNLRMPDAPTLTDREQLREQVARRLDGVTSHEVAVLMVASSEDLVILERRHTYTVGGRQVEQLVGGVFELDADDRIVAWRDYFDAKDLAAQTGADPAATDVAGSGPTAVPEAARTGVDVALQPAATPEEKSVDDFCALWGDGTLEAKPQVDRIVARMAPDAAWKLWVPGGPTVTGREALADEIRRQMQYATHNRCHTVRAVSTPSVVMQERSDYAFMLGRDCPHQMVAVYELDEQGLIVRWREYINMADLDRKRGAPAATAHLDA